jgi:hypothetical protein
MKTNKSSRIVLALGFIPALLMAALPARASTIWTGPAITFNHISTNVDQLTPGVAITRGGSGGLYNAVTESGATVGVSPQDTQWAVGALSNYNTLAYSACPLESGERPPNDVGTTYVVHLINEDIYLSLKLTAWGGAGGSGPTTFSYMRSTPAVAVAPTVSITSPAGGAIFAAPANVNLVASTNGSSVTVTNVQFFTNGIPLGSRQTLPFSLAANNLSAGAYALTAVATASGISATSAVVNITVISPPSVSITSPASGAVFAAPASVNLVASTNGSTSTVTNVQFFTNGISLGARQTLPFSLAANNLSAGPYALKAVATASGISATSAVVNVSVVNPVPVFISGVNIISNEFAFDYTASTGLVYIVQSSSNFVDWTALVTNTATASPVPFFDPLTSNTATFFRVGQLPNP